MVVDRFSTLEQLEPIRSRWQELYACDSAANLFLSWEWVSACLTSEPTSWVILGARDGGSYLAFLPLRFDRFPRRGPTLTRELWLGISARVDFTGMLGAAGDESRFLPALAREIKDLTWDTFILNNCADRRVAGLVNEFAPSSYQIATVEPTPCPYVQLPASWDEYLDSRGKSTRRTIRARLNKLQRLSDYHLYLAPPDEADSAIDALLRLHGSRWEKNLQMSQSGLDELLRRCYASGRFQIYGMYHGKELMATQGFFVDGERRTMVAYMIAYNPEYAEYSPGMMLACASVRFAIERGYERFDLSRGAQSYKMSLATNVEYITNTTVSRRSVRVAVVHAGKSAVSSAKRLARKFLVRSV